MSRPTRSCRQDGIRSSQENSLIPNEPDNADADTDDGDHMSDTVEMEEIEPLKKRNGAPKRSSSNITPSTNLPHHEKQLNLPRIQLIEHTRSTLKWKDEEEGEEKMQELAPIHQQKDQLDTSCLFSMLSSIPTSTVRALYASEMSDGEQLELATTVLNVLRYGDGAKDVDQLIQIVRAWSAMPMQQAGVEGEDFWSLLREVDITQKNLVTFCSLLLAKPQSIESFQALALYTSLLHLASLTGSSGSNTIMHELTLRSGQVLVRTWARRDARVKEAGCTKRKSKKKSANPDPFATAEDEDGAPVDDAWLGEPEAEMHVRDFLHMCHILYSSPEKDTSPKLALFKHTELCTHLQDTCVDLMRTDIDVAARARKADTEASPVAREAQQLLLALLHPSHGAITITMQSLLKHALLTTSLAFSAPTTTVPKHMLPVQRGGMESVRKIIHCILESKLADPKALGIAVYHFLQHLLLRSSEKADFRKVVAAQCARELLVPLETSNMDRTTCTAFFSSLRAKFCLFLAKMAGHKRAGIRLMALEVSEICAGESWALLPIAIDGEEKAKPGNQLLKSKSNPFDQAIDQAAEEEKQQVPGKSKSSGNTSALDLSNSMLIDSSFDCVGSTTSSIVLPALHSFLLLLVRRCADASPVVRAKALTGLAHVLEDVRENLLERATEETMKEDNRAILAWARTMRERLTNTASAGGSAGDIQRSVWAPLMDQTSATPAQAKEYSFLRTPLSCRSRSSEWGGGRGSFGGALNSSTAFVLALSTSIFHPSLPGIRDILEVLYKRSGDQKAVVRKAAIQALECILVGGAKEEEQLEGQEQEGEHPQLDHTQPLEDVAEDGDVNMLDVSASGDSPQGNNRSRRSFGKNTSRGNNNTTFSVLLSLTASDLQIFYDGCFDRSLSIRKQSLLSLSQLVKQFTLRSTSGNMPTQAIHALGHIQKVWLGAVLPLVRDQEKSVVESCVNTVQQIILDPLTELLTPPSKKSSAAAIESAEHHPLWSLLSLMDDEMRHYFSAVFIHKIKAGAVSSELIKGLIKHLEKSWSENEIASISPSIIAKSRTTWLLLDCLCRYPSSLGSSSGSLLKAISNSFGHITQKGAHVDEEILLSILSCVGLMSHEGKWKAEELAGYAEYLIGAVKGLLSVSNIKHDSSQSSAAVSHEVTKKQVWLLHCVCDALANTGGALPEWEQELLKEAENCLHAFVAHAGKQKKATNTGTVLSTEAWNESALQAALFCVGEIVLQCQSLTKSTVSQSLVNLVQTFIAPTMRLKEKKYKNNKPPPAVARSTSIMSSPQEDTHMVDDSFDSIELDLSLSQSNESQFDLSQQSIDLDTSASSAVPSAPESVLTLSASLRAHAFLTLGKMCLRNEILAKKCITLLIRELDLPCDQCSPLIQNNVLLLLCDLCRNFTNIVDPYLSSITAMLGSTNILLRKHTIQVLNVLLQEEYLRMKSSTHSNSKQNDESSSSDTTTQTGSSMFYRYLRCLVDDDAGIRQLVQVSLKSILVAPTSGSQQGPQGGLSATKIHMHFVELIYFLNGCQEHPIYNQFGSSAQKEGAGGKKRASTSSTASSSFSLIGPLGSLNASKRFTLYKYCLSLLTDEQKFLLLGKLHSEVLQPVNEDSFLSHPWYNGLRIGDVLQDTLIILASEDMQLSSTKKSTAVDPEAVEGELAELAMAAEDAAEGVGPKNAAGLATLHAQQQAKQKLLSKLLRKSTMDTCLPILFDLRSSFEKVHSPLSQWLNWYFLSILNAHPVEIGEVFAANRMLEKEIRFDLKRWKEQSQATTQDGSESIEDQHARWKRLDFAPATKASVVPPSTIKKAMDQSMLLGLDTPAAGNGVQDSTVKRHSAGAHTASTPLRASSLAALKVATSSPPGVSFAGRTFSAPGQQSAGVPATPMSFRTPGKIATPMLRRSMSTPMSAAKLAAAARSRRSLPGAPVTPSRLIEGAEPEDGEEEDGEGETVESDEESENLNSRNLIVLPSPDGQVKKSALGNGRWNIALSESLRNNGDNESVDPTESASPVKPQPAKKARIQPPANALEKLTLAKSSHVQTNPNQKKRKHEVTPVKKEYDAAMEEEPPQPPAAAAQRPDAKKRKAAGLR